MKESSTSFMLRGCFSFHSFENTNISVGEKQAELGLRNLSLTLCNLTNAFHFLGLRSLTCQVKKLEAMIFKNLSNSDSKHVCVSLGLDFRASQDGFLLEGRSISFVAPDSCFSGPNLLTVHHHWPSDDGQR